MKHPLLILLLVTLTSTTALADSPEAILKDYRKQAAQAVERLNKSLEKTATPMITKLVASGDTAGAELLTSQMKAKIAGEPVAAPQASAVQLFALYDDARAKALAPVQKSSIARIDSLLKTAGGAKLETVTELGKVREEIEAGKVSSVDFKMPLVWDYSPNQEMNDINGELVLNLDGTLVLKARAGVNASTQGKWEATSKPNVLKVYLDAEECEMRIKGKNAELQRKVGVRYLRAK